MSVGTQQHFTASPAHAVMIDRAGNPAVNAARIHPPLRYSSPRPWLLAASISIAMWAGIIWAVWRII